jgi:hypothetical protein
MGKTYRIATRDNIEELDAELNAEIAAASEAKSQARVKRIRAHLRDVAVDLEFSDIARDELSGVIEDYMD